MAQGTNRFRGLHLSELLEENPITAENLREALFGSSLRLTLFLKHVPSHVPHVQ